MAKDLNKTMLIGRLGTEPELRYTPQGAPITTFRLAVSRQWRDGEGGTHEETDWFTVVAWNRLAEICAQHLHKASRVYIEGRLQNRSWDDQHSGEKRYRTEVVASEMILLDGRPREDDDRGANRPRESGRGGGRTFDDSVGFGEEDIPF
ncbi:MAG TPA: single-stranded DNA-binding protein [Herpetosiphonaceae bacterium]|nr:single-stranded DNA-binding protein [Herpetosiphonaceae bacterium]